MNDLKYGILINKAQKQFGERGFECILAVVLAIGTLGLLLFFPVAGIALSIFTSCFLCVGIKKYLLSIARNEYMPIENVYNSFKISLKAFCLKVAYVLISFLWGIVFIIPGILCALNYSMASFIMADNENLSALECMVKSKKLVSGNRSEIFIVYLCYFLVTVMVLTIFGAIGMALQLYTNVNVWVPMVIMGFAFLFVLVIFIIPYFELTLANVYLELVKAKTPKEKKITTKTSKKGTRKSTSKTTTGKTE